MYLFLFLSTSQFWARSHSRRAISKVRTYRYKGSTYKFLQIRKSQNVFDLKNIS